jgi:hypothetical protein
MVVSCQKLMTYSHIILLPEQAYWAPADPTYPKATIVQINDSKFSKYAVRFPYDTSQHTGWPIIFPWYASGYNVNYYPKIYFRTTAYASASGNVGFKFDAARSYNNYGGWAVISTMGPIVVTVPSGTPSGTIFEVTSPNAWVPPSYPEGHIENIHLQRDVASSGTAGNNLPQPIDVLAVIMPFIQDSSYPYAGFFIPGNAYLLPTSGTAATYSNIIGWAWYTMPTIKLDGSSDSYVDFRFRLPTNAIPNSTTIYNTYWCTTAAPSAAVSGTYMIYATAIPATGNITSTPTLTFIGSGCVLHSTAGICRILSMGIPLGNPGDELLVRISRPGNDQATVQEDLYGSFVYWSEYIRTPSIIILTPSMSSTFATSGSQFVPIQYSDGGVRWLLRFSSTTAQRSDWCLFNNGAIRDQFRLRLKWKTQNTSATGIQARFSMYTAGVGSNDEVSLTQGPTRSLTGVGNNYVNEYVEDYFNNFFTASTPTEYGIRLENVLPSNEFDFVEMNVEFRATDTGV